MAHQEMSGHADPCKRHSSSLAYLYVDERKGDGNTELAVQDIVQVAVAGVVVVVVVAAKLDFVEEVLAQGVDVK